MSTPFQRMVIALAGLGPAARAAEVESKQVTLRRLGFTVEQINRVNVAAKARYEKSKATTGHVVLELVLDVAISMAKRGDAPEAILAQLENVA